MKKNRLAVALMALGLFAGGLVSSASAVHAAKVQTVNVVAPNGNST